MYPYFVQRLVGYSSVKLPPGEYRRQFFAVKTEEWGVPCCFFKNDALAMCSVQDVVLHFKAYDDSAIR